MVRTTGMAMVQGANVPNTSHMYLRAHKALTGTFHNDGARLPITSHFEVNKKLLFWGKNELLSIFSLRACGMNCGR